MTGKNTYFALRKSIKGSVTAENRLGSLLNGMAAFPWMLWSGLWN